MTDFSELTVEAEVVKNVSEAASVHSAANGATTVMEVEATVRIGITRMSEK
jgi:hypothetical protein